jgi:hypothetical protein
MSCLVAACDAGEKAQPPATPAKLGPNIVATRDPLAETLMYLPADTDFVVKVDVAALRRAKLWTTYGERITNAVTLGVGCSDALRDVSLVTMGLRIKSELSVIVVRGIDRDKTLQCLRRLKPDSTPTATFDGAFITVNNHHGGFYMVTFADANTLVMQGTKNPSRETMTAVIKNGAPLAQDKALTAAYTAAMQRLQPGAIMIVSRPGSPEVTRVWSQVGAPLDGISGTMRVTDRIDVRVQMDVATAEAATQFANLMKSQLAATKTFFDHVESTAQGKTVTIDLGLTEEQVKTFSSMVAGMTQP